ncbi:MULTISPECIES: Mu transposase C-terminal domain-containing protein [unclassified Streptomyces]|uniref:Mu transposase C-terminal domain-containing protein n=1 Tax=unclassified Streptomyces TaxID=2593676 RepID=UPI0001C1BDCC|nr:MULTISPECIES: Mu transposase C-terminal domain-containing protein [unclassified Streptomyces]AEN08715.1 Integrase catalytic region [Streptomyces sp. SirexAA-E]MYR64911.1 DDE-type integrase/transposase/recombinase [Streptomyces sp. SID4939]MYS04110.1 DDE-type integrase/transposase/recombinase [Streptomyces sp. SID4940]MYT65588.1 DDE-type integrase/transposase/recombinase [Streptomyces sp. SID8357]MYT89057.1 DDE-type integrase/transposase/recombinase [Streptomyces sp. SID8360]
MGSLKRPPALAVGQRVRFEGQIRGVLEVTAQAAVLEDTETPHRVVALIDLFETADFEILFQPERMPLPPSGLLETFAPDVMKRALWWEGHILEVLHGLPPGVEPGTPPRPGYGPGTSVTSRQKTKAAELAALGHEIKSGAVGLRRRRYTEDGLVGLARLVDHRSVRKRKEFGDTPDAVIEAMRQAIKEGVETSTRNGAYLIWRTGEILRENGGDLAELPSRRTLYRLLDRLAAGTHTTGSAVTRRSKAHGAAAPFGELTVSAPGEVMQIDSTPLDVMVRLDDGVVGKVELTGMIDVASRTLTAAVLRPTTKSVDASVLLARTVTPELMRPGWIDALKMSRSVLPHRRLLTIDERLEHAAAKPVIVPEMIVCDHGKVFVSHNFRASCRFLEIDFQPTHKGSPFEKGHIEKMLGSVATMFAQFLPGYTGRNTDHRGRHPEEENLWSLPELQDLLDEWIVAKWQNRPHEGLRDPDHPGRLFTPNQRYAALVEACGYVPVALSGQDYIELLPAAWRAVNSYGIRINNRTYDAPELGPMRRRDSGITAKRGLWEVHRDPYDVSRVWVRNHRGSGEWVQATWKYLNRAPVPFGDLAWDHVSHQLPKATEEELAEAVAALLTRAHAGPDRPTAKKSRKAATAKKDRRVAARTKATTPTAAATPPPPSTQNELAPHESAEGDETMAEVIPLGLFDPLEDPWKRS